MISGLMRAWRRRYWRGDAAALAAFAGLRPMVVITGGSEGIGFALAQRFVAGGRDVLLVARDAEKLRKAQADLATAGRWWSRKAPMPVEILPLDVTSEEAVASLDAFLAASKGYCDVLVNCAGVGLSGPFVSHPEVRVLGLVDLNMRALTRLTLHLLQPMLVRGDGGILNMASVGSYAPGPNQAVYYASKAYVLSLTEAIAQETAGQGVRICAVAPGPVKTGFHRRMGAEHALYREFTGPASPMLVAWTAYFGFLLGARVVWPGLLTPFTVLALKVLPHRLLSPVVSILLKPRS